MCCKRAWQHPTALLSLLLLTPPLTYRALPLTPCAAFAPPTAAQITVRPRVALICRTWHLFPSKTECPKHNPVHLEALCLPDPPLLPPTQQPSCPVPLTAIPTPLLLSPHLQTWFGYVNASAEDPNYQASPGCRVPAAQLEGSLRRGGRCPISMLLSAPVCRVWSPMQDYSTYSQKQNPLYDPKTVSWHKRCYRACPACFARLAWPANATSVSRRKRQALLPAVLPPHAHNILADRVFHANGCHLSYDLPSQSTQL